MGRAQCFTLRMGVVGWGAARAVFYSVCGGLGVGHGVRSVLQCVQGSRGGARRAQCFTVRAGVSGWGAARAVFALARGAALYGPLSPLEDAITHIDATGQDQPPCPRRNYDGTAHSISRGRAEPGATGGSRGSGVVASLRLGHTNVDGSAWTGQLWAGKLETDNRHTGRYVTSSCNIVFECCKFLSCVQLTIQ